MFGIAVVKTVYVGGISTEFGIRATALDAAKLGFNTIVVKEAIVSVDPSFGQLAITEMKKAGVVFAGLSEVKSDLPKVNLIVP